MSAPSVRVHQLMALEHALALELRRDDDGFEMRVVVGRDAHLRAGQPGLDQGLNFGGIHDGKRFGDGKGRECCADLAPAAIAAERRSAL